MNAAQLEKIKAGHGFFAALDQSGGSTPKALAEYGIGRDRYRSEAEMFDLVHAMRTRVLTSPAFGGSRILAAILFEQTMERDVHGMPTARYLWDEKNVVPILKVDKGLAAEQDGVQLMKPIDTLDDLLGRARQHQIFGTKMRSVIKRRQRGGNLGHRRAAIRLRQPDSGRGLRPDPRTRGQHHQPAQGTSRNAAA